MLWLILALASSAGIVAIQQELAVIDGPKGYYTTTYSKEETSYWKHLPTWIEADAKTRAATRVLDIGCGYGALLAFAAKQYAASGYCMDVSEYLWPKFRDSHKLAWAKGNVELDPIPFPGTFDVIIMTEVLEHFNFQPAPTLIKIHDALAPGGLLFLSTPDAQQWGRETKYYQQLADLPPPHSSAKIVDGHIWVYSKEELLSILKSAGFRILKLEYAPGIGHRHFNIMAARD